MTAAYNLGVVMRMLFGIGTSRSMQGMMRAVFACFVAFHTLSEAFQTVHTTAYRVFRHFRTQFRTWQFQFQNLSISARMAIFSTGC
jgi:hypothetical protein